MNDELFQYFVNETNKRLDQVDQKLEDLQQFKIEMMATARTTSLIVSAFCGLITLLVSTYVTIKYGH